MGLHKRRKLAYGFRKRITNDIIGGIQLLSNLFREKETF